MEVVQVRKWSWDEAKRSKRFAFFKKYIYILYNDVDYDDDYDNDDDNDHDEDDDYDDDNSDDDDSGGHNHDNFHPSVGLVQGVSPTECSTKRS